MTSLSASAMRRFDSQKAEPPNCRASKPSLERALRCRLPTFNQDERLASRGCPGLGPGWMWKTLS